MPYRAVARPGVCFAIELTIDAIARAVGREPADVRLDNLVPASAMPFTNITGKHFDSGDYPASVRMAVERIDLPGLRARQARGEPDGTLLGVGFATYTEQSAHGTSQFAHWGTPIIPGFEQAQVRITPDGGAEIRIGVHSHGQGMETTMAQVACEMIGIDPAQISVIHGDTAMTPFSTGTYASRSMVMAGGAVSRACAVLAARLARIGAHLLQCREDEVRLADGLVRGPRGEVTIREIAHVWYRRPEQLPTDVDVGGLEATIGYKPKVDTGAFTFATHAAVVAVDPATGGVAIVDYVIVEDCGTMVNPMIVEGQSRGGATQGIGTALLEESPYDVDRAAAGGDARRLSDAGLARCAVVPHLSHRDAVALYRSRHQGRGRRQRDRAAGRHRQRHQRRAPPAGRRDRRDPRHPQPHPRRDQRAGAG